MDETSLNRNLSQYRQMSAFSYHLVLAGMVMSKIVHAYSSFFLFLKHYITNLLLYALRFTSAFLSGLIVCDEAGSIFITWSVIKGANLSVSSYSQLSKLTLYTYN
jgi:hypothetical protein